MTDQIAVNVVIQGRVQGVCFRATTRDAASGRRLKGYVRNRPDGSVQALFQGPKADVDAILQWCWQGSPGSRVDQVTPAAVPMDPNLSDFRIRY